MTALAASLKSLRVGQRGWITLREAWHLFSPVDDEEEAFGELDDEGRKRLEDFVAAASYRSDFNYMPSRGVFAFVILAAFTYSSGLRGPAWIAIVKDILIYVTAFAAVIIIPIELGGFDKIFAAVPAQKLLLAVPGAAAHLFSGCSVT